MKRIVDWKNAKLITPEKGKRLIAFIYDNKDSEHPKIIHGDKVKVFSMTEIPSRKYVFRGSNYD